jgi:hypothetical protein
MKKKSAKKICKTTNPEFVPNHRATENISVPQLTSTIEWKLRKGRWFKKWSSGPLDCGSGNANKHWQSLVLGVFSTSDVVC